MRLLIEATVLAFFGMVVWIRLQCRILPSGGGVRRADTETGHGEKALWRFRADRQRRFRGS